MEALQGPDINEMSKYYLAYLLRRAIFCLFSSPSHSSVRIDPFSSSPFCQTSFKKNQATEKYFSSP